MEVLMNNTGPQVPGEAQTRRVKVVFVCGLGEEGSHKTMLEFEKLVAEKGCRDRFELSKAGVYKPESHGRIMEADYAVTIYPGNALLLEVILQRSSAAKNPQILALGEENVRRSKSGVDCRKLFDILATKEPWILEKNGLPTLLPPKK